MAGWLQALVVLGLVGVLRVPLGDHLAPGPAQPHLLPKSYVAGAARPDPPCDPYEKERRNQLASDLTSSGGSYISSPLPEEGRGHTRPYEAAARPRRLLFPAVSPVLPSPARAVSRGRPPGPARLRPAGHGAGPPADRADGS